MVTLVLLALLAAIVAISALVGLVRGLNKSVIRLITLALAVILTFVIAGPVTKSIVSSIAIDGQPLGEMLLESLRSTEMVGDILDAAPLMQEAILVMPAFVIAIAVFPVVFFLLSFVSWIVFLCVQKPLRRLIFKDSCQKQDAAAQPMGARVGKRFAGLGVGIVTGLVIFAMIMAPVCGLFSMLPTASAMQELLDPMVEQDILAASDAEVIEEVYAVTDSGLVKICKTFGVTAAGRGYLNAVSKIEANGQVTYLGDELNSLLAVLQTATEGGLVNALMTPDDQGALYAVLEDKVFMNQLMQDMFQSKLLRSAAPELMAIAMETVAESMNVPATKEVVYHKMMDSIALAVKTADIDYAGIEAYEKAHGITSTKFRSARSSDELMTEAEYNAEVQKLGLLAKTISSILDTAVSGDNAALTDCIADQIITEVKTLVVTGQTAPEDFDEAGVLSVITNLDAASIETDAGNADQLLQQLTDPQKFETDVATVETIKESIRQTLTDALSDDAKAQETASTLANVVSDLIGVISSAADESGDFSVESLDFEKIGNVVTELQGSTLKDVGSSVLDIVISGDLGGNDMVTDILGAVKEGYDKGEDVGGTIQTAGDLINIGSAMNGDREDNQEALVTSFTSLINNLNEYTLELLPSIFTTDTITSMGVPTELADATYNVVETLLTELMNLQGAEDYTNEVNAILHLYDLATTGVENFTQEDIPELVDCATESDAIYNTIVSISVSNPFGIEIPEESARADIADSIEDLYAQSGKTQKDRTLYNAVATLLGVDEEVNLGA